MKITIVTNYLGVTGTFLNLLDFQDYLIRKGWEDDFYCPSKLTFEKDLIRTRRKYKIGNIKNLAYDVRTDGVIVTDFMTLCSLDFHLTCEKMVIFDNAELSYHLKNITTFFYPKDVGDINKVMDKHTFRDHIFLMPPCNYDMFVERYPMLQASIFYKKINVDALNTIQSENNGKLFYRIERGEDSEKNYITLPPPNINGRFPEAVPLKDSTKMFDYCGFIYYRREDRAYYEQLGRLIFEFILLGKKVHFFDRPEDRQDGLNDYWAHYKDFTRDLIEEDYDFKPWE
jgi:hypothetical protein